MGVLVSQDEGLNLFLNAESLKKSFEQGVVCLREVLERSLCGQGGNLDPCL